MLGCVSAPSFSHLQCFLLGVASSFFLLLHLASSSRLHLALCFSSPSCPLSFLRVSFHKRTCFCIGDCMMVTEKRVESRVDARLGASPKSKGQQTFQRSCASGEATNHSCFTNGADVTSHLSTPMLVNKVDPASLLATKRLVCARHKEIWKPASCLSTVPGPK